MKFLRKVLCVLFGHKLPKLTKINLHNIFNQKCGRCGWEPEFPDILIPNDIYVEAYNGIKPKPLFTVSLGE